LLDGDISHTQYQWLNSSQISSYDQFLLLLSSSSSTTNQTSYFQNFNKTFHYGKTNFKTENELRFWDDEKWEGCEMRWDGCSKRDVKNIKSYLSYIFILLVG